MAVMTTTMMKQDSSCDRAELSIGVHLLQDDGVFIDYILVIEELIITTVFSTSKEEQQC